MVDARSSPPAKNRNLRNAYKPIVASGHDATTNYKVKKTGISALDEIIGRHFQYTKTGGLAITGRYLPLVYKIASTLASPPNNKVVIIIDYEGSFQASRLNCSESALEHIYVLRPAENTRDKLRDVIASTENYVGVMLPPDGKGGYASTEKKYGHFHRTSVSKRHYSSERSAKGRLKLLGGKFHRHGEAFVSMTIGLD
ncbi:hypothetical protein NHJ6243_009533 [Beauveria neobassiana]